MLNKLTSDETLLRKLEQLKDKVLAPSKDGDGTEQSSGSSANAASRAPLIQQYIPRPLPVQTAARVDGKAKLVNAWPGALLRFILTSESQRGLTLRILHSLQRPSPESWAQILLRKGRRACSI